MNKIHTECYARKHAIDPSDAGGRSVIDRNPSFMKFIDSISHGTGYEHLDHLERGDGWNIKPAMSETIIEEIEANKGESL